LVVHDWLCAPDFLEGPARHYYLAVLSGQLYRYPNLKARAKMMMIKTDQKNSRIFAIFWLIAGFVWLVALVRHWLVNQADLTGHLIYLIAAIISFILSWAYYRNFVK